MTFHVFTGVLPGVGGWGGGVDYGKGKSGKANSSQ